MDQPLHCTTFSAKIEIFGPAEIVLCLHEQKKINFDLRAFTWSQNYQNQVIYATLIEIYWGLSTAKYSSASHSLFTGTPVLHFPDCSGKV